MLRWSLCCDGFIIEFTFSFFSISGTISPPPSLSGRVSYLSRAIMCVKSSEGAGELLHHLEEKMEVARVQVVAG